MATGPWDCSSIATGAASLHVSVPSRRGGCPPCPSQTRACRSPASGSSRSRSARGGLAVDDPWRGQGVPLKECLEGPVAALFAARATTKPVKPDPLHPVGVPVHAKSVPTRISSWSPRLRESQVSPMCPDRTVTHVPGRTSSQPATRAGELEIANFTVRPRDTVPLKVPLLVSIQLTRGGHASRVS